MLIRSCRYGGGSGQLENGEDDDWSTRQFNCCRCRLNSLHLRSFFPSSIAIPLLSLITDLKTCLAGICLMHVNQSRESQRLRLLLRHSQPRSRLRSLMPPNMTARKGWGGWVGEKEALWSDKVKLNARWLRLNLDVYAVQRFPFNFYSRIDSKGQRPIRTPIGLRPFLKSRKGWCPFRNKYSVVSWTRE